MAVKSSTINIPFILGLTVSKEEIERDVPGVKKVEAVKERAFDTKPFMPIPVFKSSRPKPFEGSCDELVKVVRGTVNETLDGLDYNGLSPYLEVADQLEQGKSFEDCYITDENDKFAGSCVGMSQKVLQRIKEKHGIEGSLAVCRDDSGVFEHAAGIIECQDGWVLLESRSITENRIYPVPYQSTLYAQGYYITAGKRGSSPEITITYYPTAERKQSSFEYFSNIINGSDLVLSNYLLRPGEAATPIVVYKEGQPYKVIKVNIHEEKIDLEDRSDPEKFKKETITFAEIREKGLPGLKAFMGEDFHIPYEDLHAQLCKIATQRTRIKQVFEKVGHFIKETEKTPHPKLKEVPIASITPKGSIKSLF